MPGNCGSDHLVWPKLFSLLYIIATSLLKLVWLNVASLFSYFISIVSSCLVEFDRHTQWYHLIPLIVCACAVIILWKTAQMWTAIVGYNFVTCRRQYSLIIWYVSWRVKYEFLSVSIIIIVYCLNVFFSLRKAKSILFIHLFKLFSLPMCIYILNWFKLNISY